MKPILVPTDFSAAAINASEYAIELAKKFNTSILLFHVYQLPIPVATGAPITIFQDADLQAINENHLRNEAERLTSISGVKVSIKVISGATIHEILEFESHISLIVMGMKGSGFLKETLIGSTTTALFGKSKKTLLIIPEKVTYQHPYRIALACDFHEHSKVHTLDSLQLFINLYQSKLYIVNVKTMKEIPLIEEGTEEYLKTQTTDSEPIWYFPVNEDPVNGINDFVKAKQIELLAIIPHHYNFLDGLFHQRISKKMAFHTHVPLLVLHEK